MLCGKIDYKQLEIYQLAHQFVLHTYKLCETFPERESTNLTSQLCRAATCLPLNIAEGSGASSYRMFFNYLVYCYRSCLEVEAALRLCKDLGYITEQVHSEIVGLLDTLIRKLYRYLQHIEAAVDRREAKRNGWFFQQHQQIAQDAAKRVI